MTKEGQRFLDIIKVFHAFGREGMKAAVNKGEFGILKEITMAIEENNNEKVKVSTVSDRMGCHMPMVSRSLKILEEKEYILRETDPKDRRNTLVGVTEKGFERVATIDGWIDDLASSVFERMGNDKADELLELMEKFQKAIGEEVAERKKKMKGDL